MVVFVTFYIYKICDICDSKGCTFKYRLTTFETPVATLITHTRLDAQDLNEKKKVVVVDLVLVFLLFVFGVCSASAYFGYFDMVVGIHLRSIMYGIITFFIFI